MAWGYTLKELNARPRTPTVVTDLRTGVRVTMFNPSPENAKGVAQYMMEEDQKLGQDIATMMNIKATIRSMARTMAFRPKRYPQRQRPLP